MKIQLQQVHKAYRRGEHEVQVLRGLNCEFHSGGFHFIVGPSGSGKSSLLYLLGGLDQPTSGSVEIEGRSLEHWTEKERNRFRREEVGFIFQNFNLMANLSALDNVLVPFLPVGITPAIKAEALSLLSRVGLQHRLSHTPNQLSGGEQQRVAIARALLKKPKLILADEPTGELDSQTGADVFQLLRDLGAEQNATVIVVTHDTRFMTEHDYVHHIHDGVIIETRTPSSQEHAAQGH